MKYTANKWLLVVKNDRVLTLINNEEGQVTETIHTVFEFDTKEDALVYIDNHNLLYADPEENKQ